MLELFWSLVPIIFFTVLSGYFTFIEVALSESVRGRIEKLTQDDEQKFKIATELIDEPERVIAVAKIGTIFCAIFAGLFVVPLSKFIFNQINFFSIALAILFISCFMILISEFLPIRSAKQNPEEILLNNLKILRVLVFLFQPVVNFFSKITAGIMSLFGMNAETSDVVTEDEVKDLIEQGTEDGIFEESEREMVDKIFHLSDQTVYSLMTPRVHIVWLDLTDSLEKNLKIIRNNRHNIFPVGEGSLDEFRGVIYAKDLLDAALENKNLDLTALIKKPLFVPRTMETFRLVERFKSDSDSVAIVNDEYGGVIGLITLDDIAREIVGLKNIDEPHGKQFILQKDNSWSVDGLCDIDEFKRQFNFETLPDEERDHFKTMGGFVTSQFGYIPKVGENFTWNNLKFEVLNMDRARVAKILISKII